MSRQQQNKKLALNLLALVAGMVMLAYASVPLYRLFCQVTGYGGTTQQASAVTQQVLDREIIVQFNADRAPDLPWQFAPGERSHKVKIGEQGLTYYLAENLSDMPITGHATYNVVPHEAGKYFMKIACFCFTEQTLAARQKVHMPVSFFIDPTFASDPNMKDIKTITLSYTFFSAQSGSD